MTKTDFSDLRVGEAATTDLLEAIRSNEQLKQRAREGGFHLSSVKWNRNANDITYTQCHWKSAQLGRCNNECKVGTPVVVPGTAEGEGDYHLSIGTCMDHVDKALDLANAVVEAWRACCIVPIHREVKPIQNSRLQGELQKGSGG